MLLSPLDIKMLDEVISYTNEKFLNNCVKNIYYTHKKTKLFLSNSHLQVKII